MKKIILLLSLLTVLLSSQSISAQESPFTSEDPSRFAKEVIEYLKEHALYSDSERFIDFYHSYMSKSHTYSSLTDALIDIQMALNYSGGWHSYISSFKKNDNVEEITFSYPVIEAIDSHLIKIIIPETYSFIKNTIINEGFFVEETNQFEKIVTDYIQNNQSSIKGIVLDLRDNLGGTFRLMIRALNFLYDNGTILKFIDNKDTVFQQMEIDDSDIVFEDKVFINQRIKNIKVPIAIIINENTASAAELLAASLRYSTNDNIKIFGSRSAGLTSITKLIHLYKDTYMNVARGYIQTNDGTIFKDTPVIPDQETDTPEEDAYEWLLEQISTSND